MAPPTSALFYDKDAVTNIIKNGDNKSMEYVIMSNNELQTKYQTILEENHILKTQNDELEDEVDSLSKSKTVLQGYVKNELEYSKCWSNKCNVYEDLFYNSTWVILLHMVIQLCILIMLSIIPIDYERAFILTYTPVYIFVSMYNLFKMNQETKRLTKKDSEEILKIEKANQYIMDLIDNI